MILSLDLLRNTVLGAVLSIILVLLATSLFYQKENASFWKSQKIVGLSESGLCAWIQYQMGSIFRTRE